jgi:RNA polymerase sigma-70 factor (ECF subfamily)
MMSQRTKSARFFSLYTAIQPRLYAFLLMMVHHHQEAEEILQETATQLWEQFDRYQEGTDFGAWAIAIAKYKAFDFLHANKKYQQLFKTNLYEQLSEVAQSSSIDISESTKALESCLWKLNKAQRDFLSLRYKRNLSVKEIAQAKEKSPVAVYQLLSHLLALLRGCINRTLTHGDPA